MRNAQRFEFNTNASASPLPFLPVGLHFHGNTLDASGLLDHYKVAFKAETIALISFFTNTELSSSRLLIIFLIT